MLHYILSIEYSDFIIPAILGLVIWFYLIRAAVRSDSIIKNQQAMLWFMILQCKKQGVSDEEIQKLKEYFNIK